MQDNQESVFGWCQPGLVEPGDTEIEEKSPRENLCTGCKLVGDDFPVNASNDGEVVGQPVGQIGKAALIFCSVGQELDKMLAVQKKGLSISA